DLAERTGLRGIAFVDVEIEIEAVCARGLEYPVERRIGPDVRCVANNREADNEPASLRDGVHQGAKTALVVEREVDRKQRDRLQRDAAFPGLAHFGKQRPRDRRLLRI